MFSAHREAAVQSLGLMQNDVIIYADNLDVGLIAHTLGQVVPVMTELRHQIEEYVGKS